MLLLKVGQHSRQELVYQIVHKVNLLQSQEDMFLLIDTHFKIRNPFVLSFINAHAYNICCKNQKFARALHTSDIILRDGIGMEILYKAIGKQPGANLNGTDFIPEILNCYKGKKLALFGTKEPYLRKAVEKLCSDGHRVTISEHGFHDLEHYLALAEKKKPEIIVLGMGMPRQEQLSVLLRERLSHCCLIVNGGAIIDYWGNKVRRAPMWLRRIKLEWAFRLAQEPSRLFSRYVIGNLVFLRRTRKLKKVLATKPNNFRIYQTEEKLILQDQ